MDQSADPPATDAAPEPARRRVRTPGKHIVLFSLAVTFILALSTSAIKSGTVLLPRYDAPARAAADGRFYAPTEEFLVDLAPDRLGRVSYLKLQAKIVARDADALAEIKEKQPFVKERMTFFLRELAPEDFEGSEGMARVKAELTKRANLSLSPDAAGDVLIESIIIQ